METHDPETENLTKILSCFEWQQSCTEIKQRGLNLFESRQWADCEFLLGPDQVSIKAHKLIISMASPVFQSMFFNDSNEKIEQPIRIPDISPSAFGAMLNYIYTENITINSMDMAFDLYVCAKRYLVLQLKKVCSTYMSCNIDPANACRVYEIGLQNDEDMLVRESLSIIKRRTLEVLHEKSIYEVELSTVTKIYSMNDLQVSERFLFDTLYQYFLSHHWRNKRKGEFDQSAEKKFKLENGDSIPSPMKSETPEDNWTFTPHEWLLPALRNIRFLTFTPLEFATKVVAVNLLAPRDAYALLANIASVATRVPMPEGFSKERVPRYKLAPLPAPVRLPEATTVLRMRLVTGYRAPGASACSERFAAGARLWSACMTPFYEDSTPRVNGIKYFLGFFVRCEEWVDESPVDAKVTFTLQSQKTPLVKTMEQKFTKTNSIWGFDKFISVEQAQLPYNEYLTPAGDLVMNVKVQILGTA